MCLVSFIIPVFNLTEEEVSTCLSSVAKQTASDHEIIIVDDGSNNGIGEYCDTLGREYGARVIHQSNQGLAVARNTGMEVARGKWIVHVDGDDWIDRELVENIKRVNGATNADILVWGYVIKNGRRQQELLLKNKIAFDANYDTLRERALCSILDYDTSFAALALNTSWAKAYRHDYIKQNGLYYDSALRRAQDVIYNLNAFNRASRVEYIDKALNYYRTDNVSLSRGFNSKTYDYLSLTATAVERFVSENNVSDRVKEASVVFIERCFRMINVQFYQHKDNPLPYRERKKLFMMGIETEPFKSAFSNSPVRPGIFNRITDFLYKHKLFGGISIFNDMMGMAYRIKTFVNRKHQ